MPAENSKKKIVTVCDEIMEILAKKKINEKGWEKMKEEIDEKYKEIAFTFENGRYFWAQN